MATDSFGRVDGCKRDDEGVSMKKHWVAISVFVVLAIAGIISLARDDPKRPAPVVATPTASVNAELLECVEDVSYWLGLLLQGSVSWGDATMKFGSLDPKYRILREVWLHAVRQMPLYGHDQAAAEAVDLLIDRCEQEYGDSPMFE